MVSTNLMPVNAGTRTLGTPLTGSWLTGQHSLPVCSESPMQAAKHLQIVDVAPATGDVSARPFAGVAVTGADAARKRGRPPRGEPR